jgi:hypothetical protein
MGRPRQNAVVARGVHRPADLAVGAIRCNGKSDEAARKALQRPGSLPNALNLLDRGKQSNAPGIGFVRL